MTDKHVDELLADLDRALSLEPSPSVAARVRTRIDGVPVSSWLGLHRRLVALSAAAAVVVAGYVVWPSPVAVPMPVPVQTLASRPASSASAASPARPVRPSPAVPATPAAVVDREPEVLISPSQRLGLAQLAAALRDGRISADSIPPDGPIALPDPIAIQTVVIDLVKLDLVPGHAGGPEIR